MPAIIEFIEGNLNMTLLKFNVISNQSLLKFWKEKVKLCLISQQGQCFVREIDTNKKI